MNETEELEHACADAWPAQVERRIGQWRLRAAADPAPGGGGGRRRVTFTGRANSVVAVGDPGTAPEEALKQACEFAHDHGIEPMALAVEDGPVEPALTAAGWRPYEEYPAGAEVAVLLAPLPPRAPATPGARVLDAPTADWWELVAGRTEPTAAQRHVLTAAQRHVLTAAQRHVLTGVPAVGCAVAERDGVTAGAARGALTGGLLHVARLAVRPEHRRRGVATALMNTLHHWAGTHGAGHCVLQVSVSNSGALALYAGLGFREHHRYRYWVPCEDRTPAGPGPEQVEQAPERAIGTGHRNRH